MDLTKLKQKLKDELVPKTKREWFKFLFDFGGIVILLILYFLIASSYREGYDVGLSICRQTYNSSYGLINFTYIT